jgi:hypothetical protein
MNVPLWSTIDIGKGSEEIVPLKDIVSMLMKNKR